MRDIGFARIRQESDPASIVRVSEDNWLIDACPDDGPSMAIDAAGIRHVVWPTLVEGPELAKGIFHARSSDGAGFEPRRRLDGTSSGLAAQPRLTAARDGTLAVVWDERFEGSRRVVLRRRPPAGDWEEVTVLADSPAAYYPALATTGTSLLVAWTSQTEPHASITVRRMPLAR
jgi:hypothetical protein